MKKQCVTCKKKKLLEEFHRNASHSFGRQDQCKECMKAYKRLYYEKNKTTIIEKSRIYAIENPDIAKKSRIAWKSRNPEKHKQLQKEWDDRNPLKTKARRTVNNAVRDGRLRKKNCLICKRKAQAHHYDYSKPLNVIWLCDKHHKNHHTIMNAIKKMEAE